MLKPPLKLKSNIGHDFKKPYYKNLTWNYQTTYELVNKMKDELHW